MGVETVNKHKIQGYGQDKEAAQSNLGIRMMRRPAIGWSLVAAAALSASQAFADGREMQIVNQTGFEIIEFFSAHKDEADWGEDLLQGDAIGGDDTRLMDLDDGSGYCLYGFRVIFDDGEELISEDINICDLSMFTYY